MAWRPIPISLICKISENTHCSKMRTWRCQDKKTHKLLIFHFVEKPASTSKTSLKINQATFVT